MKIPLTPKEEREKDEAVSKAGDAFQEIEKTLARIGAPTRINWIDRT